jgi:hypothetical protein
MQAETGSGGHDQLFKQLLQAFFADFLRLFDPETAARLDLDTITFVNPEVFTDFPQGERRTADIVVQVRTRDGDTELILIHVEVQRKREPDFPWRMWQYYSLLRLREGKKVIPIALVLYPDREGIALEEYSEGVFDRTYLTFRYLQISLPRLSAGDYVERGPLAAGLASLMRPARRTSAARIALYIACLRGVQRAVDAGELDEARRFMLFNLIFTYLSLSTHEREAARVQLREEGDTTMEAIELTWADRMILQGREEGLRAVRRAVQRVLIQRFGSLPSSMTIQLDQVDDPQRLETLLDTAFSVSALEEFAQALR